MRAVDVAVALVNAPVTALTAAVNAATGATVRVDRHLTVVCEGGWLSERGWSSAYTTGNTVNVKRAAADAFGGNDRVLEHEWRHSVQWALLGPVRFLALYAVSYFGSQALTGTQRLNAFEWTAGFADGGYAEVSPSTQLRRVAPATSAPATQVSGEPLPTR